MYTRYVTLKIVFVFRRFYNVTVSKYYSIKSRILKVSYHLIFQEVFFPEDINTLFKCILLSACRWREIAMDSILLFKVDY